MLRVALLIFVAVLAPLAAAQPPSVRFIDDLPVNYIYANVLGTGFYDISGRQAAVVNIPLTTPRYDPLEQKQLRGLFPLVVGYENRGVDTAWEKWIPKEILSASLVPGVEMFIKPTPTWLLKPYLQAGLGRDYTQNKTTNMAIAGIRSQAPLITTERWEFTLGNALHWAGEKVHRQDQYTSFALAETGVNFKRNLPYTLLNRNINMSFFGVWQHFFLQRSSSNPNQRPIDLTNLLKVGISIGTRRPYSVLGINVDAVSVGLSFGENSYALNFGTGFPF